MTPEKALVLAYVVGGLVLWGYALLLWAEARALRKREATESNT